MNLFMIVLSSLCLLLASTELMAQTDAGNIKGLVLNEDGSAIHGILIETGYPRTVGKTSPFSDRNRAYKLLKLPPGVYTLTFTRQGLQYVTRNSSIKKRAEFSRRSAAPTVAIQIDDEALQF